ncbi:unnamed protein product, partial [Mesorhabditis spiculigera]
MNTVVAVLFVFVGLATSCSDSSSNCANWSANGFCSSTFYTTAQKTSYCGTTCGLCSGGGSSSTTCSDTSAR